MCLDEGGAGGIEMWASVFKEETQRKDGEGSSPIVLVFAGGKGWLGFLFPGEVCPLSPLDLHPDGAVLHL